MSDEFARGVAIFLAPTGADFSGSLFRHQRLVALEKFLYLHDVIGERFGGGVDGGEAAADYYDGHADLEIRHGIGLGGAG